MSEINENGTVNIEALKNHIINLSNSDDWITAKAEWKLSGITYNDDWDNCPCGQHIKEICHLKNTENNNKTFVGNLCVNRFIEIDTGNTFDGLRRIIRDTSANANQDLIDHALKFGYIYQIEYDFLVSTKRKRRLSMKQIEWKKKINWRITNQTYVENSKPL